MLSIAQNARRVKIKLRASLMLCEITFLRHAAVRTDGRLHGQSDPSSRRPSEAEIPSIRARIGDPDAIWTSPALRCRETAQYLGFDTDNCSQSKLLWEQNFGDWDGRPFAEIPELGDMSRADLAKLRPPGGETFLDLHARFENFLNTCLSGRESANVLIIGHAGIIRAALGHALADPAAGLGFEIAPFSLTKLRWMGGNLWSIPYTNWQYAAGPKL